MDPLTWHPSGWQTLLHQIPKQDLARARARSLELLRKDWLLLLWGPKLVKLSLLFQIAKQGTLHSVDAVLENQPFCLLTVALEPKLSE